MNNIESQKCDYKIQMDKFYMEPEEVKSLEICPSSQEEHAMYAAAHCMVSERMGNFDLVDMVYALLKREHHRSNQRKQKLSESLSWRIEEITDDKKAKVAKDKCSLSRFLDQRIKELAKGE